MGDRIRLRRLLPEDAPAVAEMLSDPEVMRFVGPRRPMSPAEIDRWMATGLARCAAGWSRWAVASSAGGEFLGMAGAQPDDDRFDLGWYFRRGAWGTGLPREAARLATETVHATGLAFETFVADANVRSLRMACRIGFVPGRSAVRDGEAGLLLDFAPSALPSTPLLRTRP